MELRITLPGDRVVNVKVKPADIVRMEKKFKLSAPAMGEGLSYECNLFLAYCAARRAKVIDVEMGFDDFVEYVEDIEQPDEDDEDDEGDGGGPLLERSDS